jgi:hypothetical protein
MCSKDAWDKRGNIQNWVFSRTPLGVWPQDCTLDYFIATRPREPNRINCLAINQGGPAKDPP